MPEAKRGTGKASLHRLKALRGVEVGLNPLVDDKLELTQALLILQQQQVCQSAGFCLKLIYRNHAVEEPEFHAT